MGDIAALRGVWNIVPTPFLPDGELDDASLPGLVSFVRSTGVDGMTILGVLGEAGRLGDARAVAGDRRRVSARPPGRSPCALACRMHLRIGRSRSLVKPRRRVRTR